MRDDAPATWKPESASGIRSLPVPSALSDDRRLLRALIGGAGALAAIIILGLALG